MTKLTIAQFVVQANDENIDYINSAMIITDSTADEHGIVIEADEKEICSGEAIYNFMYADDSFAGEFTESEVTENIEIMLGM